MFLSAIFLCDWTLEPFPAVSWCLAMSAGEKNIEGTKKKEKEKKGLKNLIRCTAHWVFELMHRPREAWKYLIKLRQISHAPPRHLWDASPEKENLSLVSPRWHPQHESPGEGTGPILIPGVFDKCCRLYWSYWFREHGCGLQVWDAAKLSLVPHGEGSLSTCAVRRKLSIRAEIACRVTSCDV